MRARLATRWFERSVASPLVIACALTAGCVPVSTKNTVASPGEGVRSMTDRGTARERAAARANKAIRLKGPRGVEAPLRTLDVRVVHHGPIAWVEMTMGFGVVSPTLRRAALELELPPQALLSSVAIRDGHSWRQAEAVARGPDRAVDLHEASRSVVTPTAAPMLRIDLPELPSTPTPAGARINVAQRELSLRVTWMQTFPSHESELVVPLHGIERLDRYSVEAVSPNGELRREQPSTHGPLKDLRIQSGKLPQHVVRSGKLLIGRVAPVGHDHHAAMAGLIVLVDTSASSSLRHGAQVDAVERTLAALEEQGLGELPVRLVAFDQETVNIYSGPLRSLDRDDIALLRARHPLGASDLAAALRTAASLAGPHDRVLVVSDLQATAGVQGADLRTVIAGLERRGIRRVDVLSDADALNQETCATLTASGERGLSMSVDRSGREVARRLLRTAGDVDISIPSARWSWPEHVDGLQAGDGIIVFAEVDAQAQDKDLELWFSSKEHAETWTSVLSVNDVDGALLSQAHVLGRIAALTQAHAEAQDQPAVVRRGILEQIRDLAIRHRTLSPMTRLAFVDRAPTATSWVWDGAGVAAAPPVSLPPATYAAPRIEMPRSGEQEMRLLAGHRWDRATYPEAPAPSLGSSADLAAPAGSASQSAGLDGSPGASRTVAASDRLEHVGLPGDPAHACLESVCTPSTTVSRKPEPAPGRHSAVANARQALFELSDLRWLKPEPPGMLSEPSDAHEGKLLAVMSLLRWGAVDQALAAARAWQDVEPTEIAAVLALGETLEASHDTREAARAFGSLIDLHPGRADLRRYASARLERLGSASLNLALDSYGKANDLTPELPIGRRAQAFALLRAGRIEEAFATVALAIRAADQDGAAMGVSKLLREDLGLLAAAWIHAEPAARASIEAKAHAYGAVVETTPSLRFVLTWEALGDDVDLLVTDGSGHQASYLEPVLSSGGRLWGDVQSESGPEVMTIDGKSRDYPYALAIQDYAMGPMGVGLGRVHIIEHDGSGALAFDDRPFMVSRENARVELTPITQPLLGPKLASR